MLRVNLTPLPRLPSLCPSYTPLASRLPSHLPSFPFIVSHCIIYKTHTSPLLPLFSLSLSFLHFLSLSRLLIFSLSLSRLFSSPPPLSLSLSHALTLSLSLSLSFYLPIPFSLPTLSSLTLFFFFLFHIVSSFIQLVHPFFFRHFLLFFILIRFSSFIHFLSFYSLHSLLLHQNLLFIYFHPLMYLLSFSFISFSTFASSPFGFFCPRLHLYS